MFKLLRYCQLFAPKMVTILTLLVPTDDEGPGDTNNSFESTSLS
jgi:hypothetical protein